MTGSIDALRGGRRPVGFLIGVLLFLAFTAAAFGAGALDPTFDGDGKVVTDFGGNDQALGVAIQADGKIVTAGRAGGDFALARYNVDGSLDSSFDGDGKVVTDFGGNDQALGVAIQADGKVVTAGFAGGGFALARYNVDGSLDSSFDGDGKVVTPFGGEDDFASAVAIQADGKIVAAGAGNTSGGIFSDMAVARYNVDGSLDTSFDGDGKVITTTGGSLVALDLAIQADGKIVAAGSVCYCESSAGDAALVRYNTDGTLDTSFDGDGKVFTDFGGFFNDDSANAVAIQADGKIVIAGAGQEFLTARYNTDGKLDTTYAGDGVAMANFGGNYDFATDLAIQSDGKIVAVGAADVPNSANYDFALARYNADGSLDTDFDGDGILVTDFGQNDWANGMAIGSGGRIIAAGKTGTDPNVDFALARYSSTTPPKLSINDVTRLEGNAGATTFAFTVSLSSASSHTVTVTRQTANGSASEPTDYTALAPATISFAPGQTTKTVVVKVKGDVTVEPNETFFVNLSNPTGATVADGQGQGTIQNDDLSDSASCTITGTNHNDTINGTSGNDVICGGRGDDQINGMSGNDVLKGEDGNDLLLGSDGYDLLLGGAGADDLRGGNGNDILRGGDNADTLTAGPGSDALFGDIGADSLNTQDNVSANDSAGGGADTDSCTFDSGDFITSCP